jgi:hypothetical protein
MHRPEAKVEKLCSCSSVFGIPDDGQSPNTQQFSLKRFAISKMVES